MATIGELKTVLGADLSDLRQSLNRAENHFKDYERSVDRQLDKTDRRLNKHQKEVKATVSSLNGMKTAIVGMAAAVGTVAIVGLGRDIAQAGIRAENAEQSFKAVFGTIESAQQEMDFVRRTANELGLSFTSLESSYKNIAAAAQGTALEGAELRKIFTSVSEASTVLGLSADDTSGTLRALSQMISKGNVQAEELRGQLGERLPGAFQIAADAMGVSTQELNKMLEQGEVLAVELLPKLATALHEKFGEAAKDAAQTARASFERFGNQLEILKREFAGAGFLKELGDAAADLAETMKDPEFREGIKAVGGLIGDMLKEIAEGVGLFGQFISYVKKLSDMGQVSENVGKYLERKRLGAGAYFGEIDKGKYADDVVKAMAGEIDKFDPKDLLFGPKSVSETKKKAATAAKEVAKTYIDFMQDTLIEKSQDQAFMTALGPTFGGYGGRPDPAAMDAGGKDDAWTEGMLAMQAQWAKDKSEATRAFNDIQDSGESMFDALDDAMDGWASSWSGTLTDMIWDSEASFGDIARQFGKMLTQMYIQKQIMEPAIASFQTAGGFSALFSAGKSALSFDKGGWISEPVTGVGMRSGKGYSIAENQPEYVAPPGQMQKDGGTSSVEIEVYNESNEPIEATNVEAHQEPPDRMVIKMVMNAVRQNKENSKTFFKGIR